MRLLFYMLAFIYFLGCSKNSFPIYKEVHTQAQEGAFDLSQLYDGHTFNVYVNGQKVSFSKEVAKTKSFEHYDGSLQSVNWELKKSVSGQLRIQIEAVDNLKSYIGYLDPKAFEVTLFPLDKVRLNSIKQEEAREDVRVNGAPLLTRINLLKDTTLPKGAYLLRVKVHGKENWDRKEIYLNVTNETEDIDLRGAFTPFSWYVLAVGRHHNRLSSKTKPIEVLSSQEIEMLQDLKSSLEHHKAKREFSKALIYQSKLTSYYEVSVGKEDLATADMYNNQALLHQDLGEYEKALEYNNKSLKIKLKHYPEEYSAISINYDNMGTVYYHMGRYVESIKFLKKSLKIREKYFPEKDLSLADSYNNLAVVFERVGNHKEALSTLKKALKIRREVLGEEDSSVATLYSLMGSIYESLERYDKAKKSHQHAISLHEKLLENKPKTEALASSYGAMGTLLHKLHKYNRAIHYYQKMLKIRNSLPNASTQLSLSEVYNNLAVSYMSINLFKKSEQYLQEAITLKEEILGQGTVKLQEEYKNLGWLYFRQNKYRKAYMYAKKSVDMLLTERDKLFVVLDALEYEHFIQNNQKQLDLLFQCAYYLGDRKSYEEAFSYWLQYKGSMLENQNKITSLYDNRADSLRNEQVEQLLAHKRKLSQLYQYKADRDTISRLSLEVQEHQESINKLKEALFGKVEKINIDFDTLVSSLSLGQVYVDFARIGPYYFGFAVDANRKIFFRRISTSKTREIDKLILTFRKEMRKALKETGHNSNNQVMSKLYTILLQTLLEKLLPNKSELIISTDGVLRLLPFEALYMAKHKQYLIEQKKVKYIASGREFIRLQKLKEISTNTKEVVVFANPDFNEALSSPLRSPNDRMFQMNFSALKGTKEEAESIQSLMKKNSFALYEGVDANEANFLNVKQPKVLHIATHGFLIKSELLNPMLNAGLALTGANSALENGRGEGVVTALKLSGMDLKGTELVVLSACETGLTGINAPDSVSVLSKAFMQAGAKAIVASLWSVSDVGTKDLMALFYSEINKGTPYVKALQNTKIKMIKQGVPPEIWSAFVLNGDE
jgi:CHAT domain-containing protein/Tfp pilus assembly protein PilF